MNKIITLAQGAGGKESSELIDGIFLKYLKDVTQNSGEDAGIFTQNGAIAISTDSYIISPWKFSGGDIGKIAVCGSANDVCMGGAKIEYITAGFIIEEGFSLDDLESIIKSFADELKNGNILLLSADTKVIPRLSSNAPEIFINTTGIGKVIKPNISSTNLDVKDSIIVSGNLGTHGSVIYCERNEINLKSKLKSDCAQLYPMLESIFKSDIQIHALRDATRGGLGAVLNEWAKSSNVEIEIDEAELPILDGVKGVCEILGLEPYTLANEGVCVLSVPKSDETKVLEALRSHPLGKDARIIGSVKSSGNFKVVMNNLWGSQRILDMPQGELLPRIC